MRILGLLAGLLLINVSCTLSDSSATKVSIDLGSQKVGSSSIQNIRFVAINIHYPNRPNPIVLTKDFHDDVTLVPSDLIFELKDLDTSPNVLIQLLVMSRDVTHGGMDFKYGDISMELKAGDNVASIQQQNLTAANKSGVVAGRFMYSSNDGPSGTIIGSFLPPNGKPAMDVIKEEMFNGWFNLIVLPSSAANFNYRLQESGEVLFENVNIEHFASMTAQNLLSLSQPQSYRSGESDPNEAQDLFFGFFKRSSDSGLDITGKKVCYLSSQQAVKNHYTSAPGATPTPLIYDGTTDVTGGEGKNHTELYANNACDISTANYMSLHPSLLSEREGEALGMRGPFANMNPLIGENGYTRSDYDSANTQITLKWQYLHGITDASVNGVTVYGKHLPGGSGGGGGGDDLSCDKSAEQKGLDNLGDVLRTNAPNTEFNQGSIASVSEAQDWRFMVCPYKDLPTGERHYYSASIENHCRGNCQDLQNFGIGANASPVDSNDGNFTGIMGGASARVVGITAGTYSTSLVKAGGAGVGHGSFDEGSEILLMVVGEDNNGCDANGNDYNPGYFEFTKALFVDNSNASFLTIPKGTFADNLTTDMVDDAADAGTTFCYVQAVEVPHFQDLIISMNLTTNEMLYDNDGGGVIAFRVNGTLNLNADVDASHKGFARGVMSFVTGAGQKGSKGSVVTATGGNGTVASNNAGGGGGYGNGANGDSGGASGGAGFGSQEQQGILMALGGGGGHANGVDGGNGGGAIFISAKNISASSSPAIKSSGQSGAGGSNAGGGGGGGSVNIFADAVSGSTLFLRALGGDGGNDGSGPPPNYIGGAGGGGWIRYGFCSMGGINFDNSGGTSAQTTSAQLGNSDNSTTPHFCN